VASKLLGIETMSMKSVEKHEAGVRLVDAFQPKAIAAKFKF